MDTPPEHALLTGEPLRTGQGLSHRIVLAREPAHQHLGVEGIDAGHRLCIIEHLEKVLIDQICIAPAGAIHLGGPLFLHRRFELVGPHHLEAGALPTLGGVQARPESAHPRKKLQGAQRAWFAQWARGFIRLLHRRLREARRRRA